MALDKDGHISRRYTIELDEVKARLLEMGGMVEKQLVLALESLIEGDSGTAQKVRDTDHSVNAMEVAIDEECARILARRQPAASDLRLVIAIGKVNAELERIGDEVGRIAEQAIQLSATARVEKAHDQVRRIGERVGDMLHRALDAFARMDAQQALAVAQEDDTVDREYDDAVATLVTAMTAQPQLIAASLKVIWVLRAMERVGDHACNIAEYVIYLVVGSDVRHIGLEAMAARVDAS